MGGGGGVQLGPLDTAATNRPIVPAPGDYDDREIGGMMIGMVNRKYSEKNHLRAALSTTNPTCCPDAKPGRRCGKPATYRLTYGTAKIYVSPPLIVFVFDSVRVVSKGHRRFFFTKILVP
jgi:hypothetical protein